MKCGVCHAPLHAVGAVTREYRDNGGRVYKRIRHPRYAPCSRLEDPEAHPARHRPRDARTLERAYDFRNRAGCVEIRRRRQTGREVGIYHASQAGIEEDPTTPWAVVCEPHGSVLTVASLDTARLHAPDPCGWCEDCRDAQVDAPSAEE